MRLTHLCLDEKFIPFAQRVYEAAYPGANRWRVYTPDTAELSNVSPADNTSMIDDDWLASAAWQAELRASDCLIVHFLDPAFFQAVLDAPEHLLKVWHGWGEDIYPFLTHWPHPALLPQTRRLLFRLRAQQVLRPRSLLNKLVRKARHRYSPRQLAAVLQRFDRISMGPEEFRILERSWPEMQAEFQMFHYNSVQDVFARGPERMQGPNILLGNSASASNNHLEAFSMLRELDLSGRTVYCPLSYGDVHYARAVAAIGRRQLGDAFVPLLDFLPIDDYYSLIAGCGVVMMNHVRQQAVGSIGTALYKGACVYLREENSVLNWFREMGATLFDMNGFDLGRTLDETRVAKNRAALESHYSFQYVVDCITGHEEAVASKRSESESRLVRHGVGGDK